MQGLVSASFGNNYTVYLEDENSIIATFKGKTKRAVVGDIVELDISSYSNDKPSQASINSIYERKNLLYRSDGIKNKAFASNIDHVLIIVATEPSFNPALIDRAILACSIENIAVSIILNKCDLTDKVTLAQNKLKIYHDLGYEVIQVSSFDKPHVYNIFKRFEQENKRCLLMGQSGMGKSSLINSYMPHVKLEVQNISVKLDSGKHTTTHTKLYPFNHLSINKPCGYLIDSPGFQLFGLHHISVSQLMHSFIEFKPFLGQCKFHNCTHQHEPNCAILEAYKQGLITKERIHSYISLLYEASSTARYK